MYKCKKCGKSSKPGESKQVITKYHDLKDPITKEMTKQAKCEIPVCSDCKDKEESDI